MNILEMYTSEARWYS